MSKHFSCKDCCKYQTDACDNPKYAESGKHLCPAYVLDIEECYQKGYQKGREDALNQLLAEFCTVCDQEACEGGQIGSIQECETIGMMRDLAEQLKEQSNAEEPKK